MSESKLSPKPKYPDIILALDLMDTTPPRFHWFFYIANDSNIDGQESPVGTKLHAIGDPSTATGWSYDRTLLDLLNSTAVASAAIVGRLGSNTTIDHLDALLGVIALELPEVDKGREPRLTCRVWCREALRRMNDAGIIACEDVGAMEAEMWEYGGNAAKEIEDDVFEGAKLWTARNSR